MLFKIAPLVWVCPLEGNRIYKGTQLLYPKGRFFVSIAVFPVSIDMN